MTRPDVSEWTRALAFLESMRPEWQADALCREYPELDFVARSPKVQAQAIQVCGRCSVREECRDYADELGDMFAVLGGEDPAARKARWRVRGRGGAA